jgi:transglutaminase-like putative cysteine protease
MKLTSVSGNRAIGPLQVYTLARFDGTRWQPDSVVPDTTKVTASDLLWPVKDPGSSHLTTSVAPRGKPTAIVSVQPVLLPRARIAVPTEPRAVASSTSILYDPAEDEVYRGAGSTDSSYTISIYRRDLEARSLEHEPARFAADSAVAPRVEAQSLQVPHSSHIADIAALTKKITASGKNDYERALLVQAYFRDASVFSYSTKAPRAVTGDPVWDFLRAQSGYCVQYATAMAIMLRTLGLPTRIGVGYLTHAVPARGTRDVTERDAHAWPEVYFAGSGWVRFEPTPAVQSGAVPTWTAEPIPGGSTDGGYEHDALDPRSLASSEPLAGSSKVKKESHDAAADTATGVSAHRPVPEVGAVVAGLALVLMLILGTALWWWRRRRLRKREIHDAEDAWRQLRRRLESLDITWPDSVTPRRTPGLVAGVMRERNDAELAPTTSAALEELVDALEGTRYGRAERTTARSAGELADRVEEAVVGIRESLGSASRAAR